MKKVYLCFILITMFVLSSCKKEESPKTDMILDPIVNVPTIDHSHIVMEPQNEDVWNTTIDEVLELEPIKEVFKTKVVMSSTGKSVMLQIPNPTKVIISKSNGITVDKQEVMKLENLMNSFDRNVSFCYIDLNTGLTMEARADIKYAAASVIKAPFVKSILESSKIDLEEEIALQKKNYHGGTGILQYESVGKVYKIKDLIQYTIEESDNVAYDMLCRRYGFKKLLTNAKKLGIQADQSEYINFGHLSSRDAALYFQDIYKFASGINKNGQILVDNLVAANYNELLKAALPQYEVAEKYGFSNYDILYHTAAIVYSDNPYVIAIFSNLDETDPEDINYMKQIATSINKIHESQK